MLRPGRLSGPEVKGGHRLVSGAGSYPTCSKEDLAMRYDWTPLWRSTIGFDRLFDVLDEVQRTAEESYPPYNIERLDENRFQISVALAGFTPAEVALTVEQNVLTLEGRKGDKEEKTFLHRGISARSFKRQFTLADHVEVKGARFENGLLLIDLQREIPEAMKPRRIAINGAGDGPGNVTQIEAKAA
jgi:molecular chaperone IbpA